MLERDAINQVFGHDAIIKPLNGDVLDQARSGAARQCNSGMSLRLSRADRHVADLAVVVGNVINANRAGIATAGVHGQIEDVVPKGVKTAAIRRIIRSAGLRSGMNHATRTQRIAETVCMVTQSDRCGIATLPLDGQPTPPGAVGLASFQPATDKVGAARKVKDVPGADVLVNRLLQRDRVVGDAITPGTVGRLDIDDRRVGKDFLWALGESPTARCGCHKD